MEYTIIILFLAVFAVIAIFGFLQSRQRKKDLAAFAAEHGLSFREGKDPGLRDRYPAFECLRQGDSDRYGFNFMQGDWHGRALLAFDYHYETRSTDAQGHNSSSSHRFSAVIVTSAVPLRPLLIRPEGFFDKVKAFLGSEDINFESAEFSRKFYVAAPDRKWAYDVIHPRAMEFLLSMPQFHVKFDTACVMAWRSSTFAPEEFASAAEVVRGLLDRLPEYLVNQQAQPGGVN